MSNITGTFEQMAMLFVVACVGFLAAKLGYLDNQTKDRLTKVLLNITLPCMIVASVDGLDPATAGARVPWAFALSAVQFFALLATSYIACVLLRVPAKQRTTYLFMGFCTNTGFIGIPVVAAIFGNDSVLVSSIFVMVLGAFVYSVGFAIGGSGSASAGASNGASVGASDGTSTGASSTGTSSTGARGLAAIPWKSIVNPSMVACVIAIALFFSRIQLPHVVTGSLDMIGGVTSPLALMIVGVIMANVDIRSVLAEFKLYPFILIRRLIVPTILFAILSRVVPDALLVGAFTVMFAMPTGSMVPLFLAQLGGDPILGAKGTILSTASSFLLIPALVVLMGLLG